ncbi:hypothetical protein EYF80_066129 [Liparis tanakae]|uniref:Uncharacterized protein n=1 Tax=Liparis tanakae TaxID=230148 RepID=A0A4Z2E4R8_9TELE|nr:hypothetical protein EYF80_066129 [Liparis tanakae]
MLGEQITEVHQRVSRNEDAIEDSSAASRGTRLLEPKAAQWRTTADVPTSVWLTGQRKPEARESRRPEKAEGQRKLKARESRRPEKAEGQRKPEARESRRPEKAGGQRKPEARESRRPGYHRLVQQLILQLFGQEHDPHPPLIESSSQPPEERQQSSSTRDRSGDMMDIPEFPGQVKVLQLSISKTRIHLYPDTAPSS